MSGPLLVLLELMSTGVLYVFQHLAVELLLGILDFQNLGRGEHLLEFLKVFFLKLGYFDVGLGLGVDGFETLLISSTWTGSLTHESAGFMIQFTFFLLELVKDREECIGLIGGEFRIPCYEFSLLLSILGRRELSATVRHRLPSRPLLTYLTAN